MSRLLSELLGAKEPLFSRSILDMEKVTGKPGVDTRLIAEIIGKVQLKTRELGFDPDDTTPEELYRALINLVRLHDAHLAKQIGGDDPEDVQTLMPLIKKAVDGLDVPRSAWVLRKSVAKRMLRDMPPPAIMKHLHYKSIDSMLKYENLGEVYGALRFAEGPEWLDRFNASYKQIEPTDFETRDIEIVMMDRQRWGGIAEGFVHKKRHNITHLKELGVIVMLPTAMERMAGVTLTALPLLLHYLNEIRLYSAFFKLQQVKPNFGKVIVETLTADPDKAAVLVGTHIHWRVIQRYFGKLEKEKHPEIFEPHVQPEDLHWRKAEEWLYKIDPELTFWRDMDYVATPHRSRPIPFNLMDVSMSYVNGLKLGEHLMFHFRESLWNEIFMRYMGEKVLEQQILQQLDNDMLAPESIARKLKGAYA
jgi:hypothetical protein